MKIDFNIVPKDLDGSDFTDKGEPVKILTLATNALLASFQDEPNIQGTDKYRRFKLAEKIHAEKVDLTAEEITEIKLVIGKAYPPLIVGRCYDILDQKQE